MQAQKYSVNQHQISMFLAYVKAGQIAIPEVQRPFVWDSTKVRDLMDSLYKGYPIGYVISWQNPNVRLKDGQLSQGKKILIDGQQRITALKAAILGDWVINKEYDKIRIRIAFNPQTEKFEVTNPAILKDKAWIADVSEVMNSGSLIQTIVAYQKANPEVSAELIENSISNLLSIQNKQIGVIELAHDLDIETVTEIFIRINSQGVVLSQADFAMSKMAANETLGGPTLRKAIDYFCHLAIAPHFFEHIRDHDKEFSSTEFFGKMAWLKNEQDDLYDPDYTDMLRVAFISQYDRARMADLVSLLSGRNFETRDFEESIAAETYEKMKCGVLNFMNETNFKRFLMIIRAAGFITPEMIRSKNVLNFAYVLYLRLREQRIDPDKIERIVRKWFVYSILTSRYGGSPESAMDYDVRQFAQRPFEEYLQMVEESDLSNAFWTGSLIQRLNTASINSPFYHVFLASMVKGNDKGFLSKDIDVASLLLYKGDVHHIFPKGYLKKNGKSRTEYNQIANYVLMQQEINIAIGSKSPEKYFNEIKDQCEGGKGKYGGIKSMEELNQNMVTHCIPSSIFNMNIDHYDEFLEERRALIANKIKKYYKSL